MFVLIFNIHPEENIELRNPVIKEELCRQPYEKPVKDTFAGQRSETYHYYSLPLAAKSLGDITRLPKSLKVLLENLLRWQDGNSVTKRISTRWQDG
ncbi:hypothetical protein ACLK1V_07030 [Escherichia coli]